MGRHSAVPTTTRADAVGQALEQDVTGPIPVPRRPVASSGPLPVVPPPFERPLAPAEVVQWASTPDRPRLLAGWQETGRPADLEEHLRRYGPPPRAEFAGRR